MTYIKEDLKFQYNFSGRSFDIIVENSNSVQDGFKSFKDHIAVAAINKFQIQGQQRSPWQTLNKYYCDQFQKEIDKISKSIIYIPDKRIIQENNNIEKSNSFINGANLISKLFRMKNYKIGEDDEFRKLQSIEKKVAEILNVDKIEIQISESKKFVLIIDDKRLLLENFGTGIHDLKEV